ncbi:hypothetical protein [Peterkaempfera griseoplana]|uniref:hypothetical protein n=1 Tax=Peterkaempfera griseoplana TaxID=66896 RepID=UPI0006E1A926|nr:hypothetical protein [Peterkaempfera griseoplana]
MGWASGDQVFAPVARKLVELGASAEVKRQVCSVLINALQDRGWDTEGESLGEFQDDPAIVAAFRERGVVATCGDQGGPPEADWCALEEGHEPDHADDLGHTWPRGPR